MLDTYCTAMVIKGFGGCATGRARASLIAKGCASSAAV